MTEPIGVGDIIRLSASPESSLAGDYIVKFINSNKIIVVSPDGKEKTLDIDGDTGLTQHGIDGLVILKKADFPGFAKQNGLLEGSQIEIELEDGQNISGKIVALEEDAIKG